MSAPPIKQPIQTMAWFSQFDRRIPRSASRHMAWKELRQIAPLAIVFVALMVFTLIAANHDRVSKLPNYNTPHGAFWYAVIFPFIGLFSLTIGVFLFAPEKENKTIHLLQRLPVTSGFVVRSKIFSGLIAIFGFAAIGALCQLVEYSVFKGNFEYFNEQQALGIFFGLSVGVILIPLECFLWAVVCSLAIKRTIYAALAAAGCVLVLCWMIPGIATQFVGNFSSHPYTPVIVFAGLRIILFLLGTVLLYRLSCKWLGNSPQVEPVLVADFGLPTKSSLNFVAAPTYSDQSRSVGHVDEVAAGPKPVIGLSSWRMFRSLIWQSFRQFQWSFFVAVLSAIPFALFGFILMLDRKPSQAFENGYIVMLFSAVLMTLVGALFTFTSDHRNGNFRFFQQHVECGSKVWFARLLPVSILATFSIAAVCFVMLLGLGFIHDNRAEYEFVVTLIPLAFLGIFTAFAIGQFNSLLFRSGVFSFAVTIAMAFISIAWIGWLYKVGTNPWLYFAPVPMALIAISWWWTPRWLAGKNRISQLLVPHAMVLLAAVITFGIFSYHRYSENPPVAFSSIEEQSKFNALDRKRNKHFESARLIVGAADGIKLSDDEGDEFNYSKILPELFSTDRIQGAEAFLADHQLELKTITKAIKSQTSSSKSILDPKSIQSRNLQVNKVRFLLAVAAKHEESEGELEKALEYWPTLLRFDESYPGYQADDQSAIDCILRWSKLPDQTPELVKLAIEEIGLTEDRWRRLADNSKYFGQLDLENWYSAFQEGQTLFSPPVGFQYVTSIATTPSVFIRAESERSRRLAHTSIAVNRRIYDVNKDLAIQTDQGFFQRWGSSFPYSFWSSLGVPNESTTWDDVLYSSHYELFQIQEVGDANAVRNVLMMIQERRYAQVRLALRGWKLEHDEYPDSLDELAPKYFSVLPVDVFYGGKFAYSPKGCPEPVFWTGRNMAIHAQTPFVLPWSLYAAGNEPIPIDNLNPQSRVSSQFSVSYDYSDPMKYVCQYYKLGRFELEN